MASQLMADETERSSSDSSSEPRRPRMKRPNGDWRLRPLENETGGAAFRATSGAIVWAPPSARARGRSSTWSNPWLDLVF